MRADMHKYDVVRPSALNCRTDQRGDRPVIRYWIAPWLAGAVAGDQLHNMQPRVLLEYIAEVDYVVFGPLLREQREPDVEQLLMVRSYIRRSLLGGQERGLLLLRWPGAGTKAGEDEQQSDSEGALVCK